MNGRNRKTGAYLISTIKQRLARYFAIYFATCAGLAVNCALTIKRVALIGLVGVLCTMVSVAHGLEFRFNNDSAKPLSADQMAAVYRAAAHWEQAFSDPVTIRINVGWADPHAFSSEGILASVRLARTRLAAELVVDALLAEATAGEAGWIAALPQAIPAAHSAAPLADVELSFANAKALNIAPTYDPTYGAMLEHHADASIQFNLLHEERFAYREGDIGGERFDFAGVVSHELGHALGFTSVVDLQALNGSTLLAPSLLDVFRFDPTMPGHNLTFDTRQTLPGPAEFYDDSGFVSPFAFGVNAYDVKCNALFGLCSASHWRDTTDTLMTTASPGRELKLRSGDIAAVDRIGVDTKWRNGIPIIDARLKFYPLIYGLIPDYDPVVFDTKTLAPKFSDLLSPSWFADPMTNVFHISFDGHAGAGFAVFKRPQTNSKIKPINFNRGENGDKEGSWEEEPQPKMLDEIPARLTEFYFETINKQYSYRFINTFSNHGSQFDPNLGPYGGFRISGYLDGNQDGDYGSSKNERRDYDASLTLLMVLTSPRDMSSNISNAEFVLYKVKGEHVQDNIAHLIDATAFAIPAGYGNSDSYDEALKDRIEKEMDDPEPGRDIAF
ncbi:NF038122 family metalloprotease [Teredinibacter turnerae]|uniref:NF038122 family metalloprotease n=1 Tax=Teredinibacter turnerae TaxID=2426 RepID=UPI000362A657|nr:NF038122 family metalloprotease [Teredinibacter turnerae]